MMKKLQKKEHEPGLVNRKSFVKVLNENGLSEERMIEFCLSEIALCSSDMGHLRYIEFFERFSK